MRKTLPSKPSVAYSILQTVRSKLKHSVTKTPGVSYLDTGNATLNQVLGHPNGIAYNRLIEISGLESGGKTTLALYLAGLAQKDGAKVVWVDLEDSFDYEWAAKRGLEDGENIVLIQPYVGTFPGSKEPVLSTAEHLCEEAQKAMEVIYNENPNGHIFCVVDSVASMLVKAEMEAGLSNRGFKAKMALPEFLGALLRQWCSFALTHNATIILINQLRQNPMQLFGDTFYSPGGNAIRFYCHVRVRAKTVKGRKMMKAQKQIGIKGVLVNAKNKAGSVERQEIGYRIFFDGRTKFVDAAELLKEK